jgi:DNA-binding protein HU-beta
VKRFSKQAQKENILINKKFIADSIVHNYGLKKSEAASIVDFIFDTIATNLQLQQEVDIHGFGKFLVAEREARLGRNPRTGEAVDIAAKNVVRFKAAKALSETVNTEAEDPVVTA